MTKRALEMPRTTKVVSEGNRDVIRRKLWQKAETLPNPRLELGLREKPLPLKLLQLQPRPLPCCFSVLASAMLAALSRAPIACDGRFGLLAPESK